MKSFEGKTVYITGGSSGIGLEMGKLFAAQGADLLLIARNAQKLEEAARAMSACKLSQAQRIDTMSVDVADHSDVEEKMAAALQAYAPPDILVCSAGINKWADHFENITHEKFDEVIKINLYGPRNMIHTLLPIMKKKKGHVVILSSAAGLFGMFGYTAYGTSKAALLGFAESLRYEIKPLGMKLTVVCPPEVDTPMNLDEAKTLPREGRVQKSLAWMLTPEYTARVIVRAIAKEQYFFIPGFQTKFLYLLHRLTNGVASRITSDAVIRLTRRGMGK